MQQGNGVFLSEEEDLSQLGKQVKSKLLSLPAPVNEYSIALPEEMKQQIEEDLKRSVSASSHDFVEDAGDLERRQRVEREREQQRQMEKRSSVLKRNLPRPKAVNLNAETLSLHSDADDLAQAERLVQGCFPFPSYHIHHHTTPISFFGFDISL